MTQEFFINYIIICILYASDQETICNKKVLKAGWTHESDATAWELIKSFGDNFISLFLALKSDLDASVQSKIDAQDNLAQNAEDATATLVTDLLNRITTEKTSLLNRLSDPTNSHLTHSEDYLNDQVSSARLYIF